MSDVDGTVTGIQGVPVNAAAPNDKEALLFDANTGEWTPGAPPQPLEPWVGSVNTQTQVVQRIPWTCSTTGTTPVSTGVSYTLPTDTGLVLVVCAIMRLRTSPLGVFSSMHHMVISNVGGTLVTPATSNVFVGGANGSIASGQRQHC